MKFAIQNSDHGNSINKPINTEYIVRNGLCVGCGVCEAACPNNAIKVIFDGKNDVPIPTVNETLCNNCRICLDVCYGYKVDKDLRFRIFRTYSTSIVGNYIRCYIGHACDQKLRFSSTSGGVVTAILAYALKQGIIDGAIVTQMEAGNPPKAKALIASTIDEVLSARGSKYCPVSFAECLKNLEKGKKYAVVGLPCHLYGIRRLAQFNAKIRHSVCYYFGLLCGGMPSYFGTLYILRNYNMSRSYITKFEYRGGGWPGRLLIRSKLIRSNQEVKICVPYAQYWRDSDGFFLPYRCTVCHDGFNEFSDISFGDAWLPQFIKKDNKGTSLIITRTDAGENLFKAALEDKVIHADSIDVQDAINSQRGLVQFKLLTLRARINLSRKLRRKLPFFDLSRSPSAGLGGYLSGVWLYLGRSIAGKKDLWWLFDVYASANSLMSITRYYLRQIQKKI